MVLSANMGVSLTGKFGNIQTYAVGAGTRIYRGASVCVKQTNGYAYAATDDTDDSEKQLFVGIAQEEINNTAGSNGALNVRVRQDGRWERVMAGAAQSHIGKLALIKDDETVQIYVDGTETTVIVGRITEVIVEGSSVRVDITIPTTRIATSVND